MSHILDDFTSFLEAAATSWHTTQEVGNRLSLHDFTPLCEAEPWKLEKGKRYFVIRGGAIAAFIIPEDPPKKALIVAAHTDSPGLKLKPCPEFTQKNMTLLGVEVYGSPLLSSWLNRELVIAGRVFVSDAQGKIEERITYIDDAPLMIPQLALHLNREVNEKGGSLNKQEHLPPLVTLEQVDLEGLLRRRLSFHTLLGFDLMLVPLQPPAFIGAHQELLAAYRLDNLTSVHAATVALCRSAHERSDALKMALFFDHEEIGSRSSEGALSPFLSEIFARVTRSLHMTEEAVAILKRNSLCISADMAHALHPHSPEKHDPQHAPLLGKGVVLKYSAERKYATDGKTGAAISLLAHRNNLPLQSFVSRSDLPSGSTIGPMVEQTMGIPTVDIGVAQLSMHSTREILAWNDYIDLTQLLTHFFKDT